MHAFHFLMPIAQHDPYSAGLLMLVGVFLASRVSGLFALIGGSIGVLTAIAIGAPEPEIADGLWGYDATLASICVGGLFFRLSPRVGVLALFAALQAVLLHGALRSALFPVALPPLTVAAAVTCLFGPFTHSCNGYIPCTPIFHQSCECFNEFRLILCTSAVMMVAACSQAWASCWPVCM